MNEGVCGHTIHMCIDVIVYGPSITLLVEASREAVDLAIHCLRHLPSSWYSIAPLASFPGRRRNGLATSVSSNCIRMLRHGNCNISFQQSSARDTYNFSSRENGAFLLLFAVGSTTKVKQKSFEQRSHGKRLHQCDCAIAIEVEWA